MADHTFYSGVGAGSLEDTVSEIIYYATEASEIFQTSDFDGNEVHDNIVFMIDEVTVYETSNDQDYQLASLDLNVDRYLDMFSKYNFDGFCLGVVFTHRDFDDGVIGLAWMASSSVYSAPGGICQRRIMYELVPNEPAFYSFNTLLVSSLNYGVTLPRQVTALTLAHEIGHAFGAPHDEDSDDICSPGGIAGNFIMHPYATDGDKPNNYRFSPCSTAHISPVVERKGGCLERRNGSSCGNLLVEVGEECDCGSPDLCASVDQCCEPPGSPLGGCRFAVESDRICSPTTSTCCSEDCQYLAAENETICRAETECSLASLCNGTSELCPPSVPKPDGTRCQSGICYKGSCTHNFCQLRHLHECECTEHSYQCHLCCSPGQGSDSPCIPATHYNITDSLGLTLFRRPGQTCNNYRGYCDQQLRCIQTDKDGSLDRFRDAFSSGTLGKNIISWIENYWYLVLVAVVLTLIFAGVFMAHSTTKVDPGVEVSHQSVKLTKLWQQTMYETRMVDSDLAILEQKYRDELAKLTVPQSPNPLVGLARLRRFFPTVTLEELRRITSNSGSEEFAVRQLLIKGYPLKIISQGNE